MKLKQICDQLIGKGYDYDVDILMDRKYDFDTILEVSKILDFVDEVIHDVEEELFDLFIQGVIDKRTLSYYKIELKKMFYPNYIEPVTEKFWSSRGGLYPTTEVRLKTKNLVFSPVH